MMSYGIVGVPYDVFMATFHPQCTLENSLLPKDVANLAMLAYNESIRDYSFFLNSEIVGMYSTMILTHLLS